jgi:RNA 3'-terminal phosphate cyclase (ATP)
MVVIDGGYGEGGGQVIRTSLSLAAITGQPFAIHNIRIRRSRPGLQPQHLAAVRAAAEICRASVRGDAVGSVSLTFVPAGEVRAGSYRFEIGTAGAAPLVAQTVLVPLALAKGAWDVAISGGTHVPMAPTADYLEQCYARALAQVGIHAAVSSPRPGFFPKGGGEVRLSGPGGDVVRPLRAARRGGMRKLSAFILTSKLRDEVADRGAQAVCERLEPEGHSAAVSIRRIAALDPGAAVMINAECEPGLGGFVALGEKGLPMERVARRACDEFLAWWRTESAFDGHLSDQLVLPLSLAGGPSRWTATCATEHLRTVLWVAQQFLSVGTGISTGETGDEVSIDPVAEPG